MICYDLFWENGSSNTCKPLGAHGLGLRWSLHLLKSRWFWNIPGIMGQDKMVKSVLPILQLWSAMLEKKETSNLDQFGGLRTRSLDQKLVWWRKWCRTSAEGNNDDKPFGFLGIRPRPIQIKMKTDFQWLSGKWRAPREQKSSRGWVGYEMDRKQRLELQTQQPMTTILSGRIVVRCG